MISVVVNRNLQDSSSGLLTDRLGNIVERAKQRIEQDIFILPSEPRGEGTAESAGGFIQIFGLSRDNRKVART